MTTACELLQKWRENGGKMATGTCKLIQMAGKWQQVRANLHKWREKWKAGVKIKSNRGARILC